MVIVYVPNWFAAITRKAPVIESTDRVPGNPLVVEAVMRLAPTGTASGIMIIVFPAEREEAG